MTPLLWTFVKIILFMIVGLINVALLTWYERKVIGRFQFRMGPTVAGPKGLLQPIADVLKLLQKESIIPFKADKILFLLAPAIAFIPAMALYLVIPIGPGLQPANLNYGLVFMFAMSSFMPLALVLAGFSSHNKFSLLGGMRAAAQQISYEVPLFLAALAVVLLAGSLNLGVIVNAQKSLWFVILQPVAFLIFLSASVAELNRPPFDTPAADSELVGGFSTEYTGIKFAIFFLVEYSNLLIVGALTTTLFLGGWRGPLLPPFIWFFAKTYFVIFLLIWVRTTFPRVRVDQLMNLCWKVFIPISIANLLITSVLLLYSRPVLSMIPGVKL